MILKSETKKGCLFQDLSWRRNAAMIGAWESTLLFLVWCLIGLEQKGAHPRQVAISHIKGKPRCVASRKW